MKCSFINTDYAIVCPNIFNGAIFELNNQKYLAYRANWTTKRCELYITPTDDEFNPLRVGQLLNFPEKTHLYEDPRFIKFNHKNYLAVADIDTKTHCQYQGLAELDENFNVCNYFKINYGDNWTEEEKFNLIKKENHFFVNINKNITYEKNWAFFVDDNKLHFVYKTQPATILITLNEKFEVEKEYCDHRLFNWPFGDIRGGVVLKVDDTFYHFFHSSEQMPIMDKMDRGRVYFMGCYTFKKINENYELLKQTRIPLEIGNYLDDTGLGLWDNAAIFPCGGIFDKNEFKISYGYNDHKIKLLTINKEELDDLLIDLEKPNYLKIFDNR